MSRRRTTWLLRPTGQGDFDVLKNGRTVLVHVTETTGLRYIRRFAGPGDRTQREADDGYRERI